MKKIFTCTLTILLALALLAGCGSKKNQDTETSPSPEVTETAKPEESAKPEETDKPEETEEPEESAEPENTETPEETPAPEQTPAPENSQKPETETPVSTTAPTPAPAPDDGKVDLAAFFEKISGEYEMPALMEIDDEALNVYYAGLNDISLEQKTAYMAMISAAVGELVMVECSSESDAAAVKAIFEQRVEDQVSGGAWYPATIAGWEKTQIVVEGPYVALICFDDNSEAIAEAFRELVK